jgi:hypothetical protein
MNCSIESIKSDAENSFNALDFSSITDKRFDSKNAMHFNYENSKFYSTQKQATTVALDIKSKIMPLINRWANYKFTKQGSGMDLTGMKWLDLEYSPNSVILKYSFPKELERMYMAMDIKSSGELDKNKREISVSQQLINKYIDNMKNIIKNSNPLMSITDNDFASSYEQSFEQKNIFSEDASEIEEYKLNCKK